MPGEDLATRIRVMLIEHQVSLRRVMAALLDRRPDLEVIAQTGSLTEARRRTAMVMFVLTVLDLVAALQALRLNQPGVSSSGSPVNGTRRSVPCLDCKELDVDGSVTRIQG
jgi:hypothetical protein